MLCPKCGTENQEQAEVCVNCETRLTESTETANSENSEHVQTKQAIEAEPRKSIEWDTDKPKPRITNVDFQSENSTVNPVVSPALNLGVLLGTIILPIIGIAMGFAYLRKTHPDAKKAGKLWLIVGGSLFLIHGLIIMTTAK